MFASRLSRKLRCRWNWKPNGKRSKSCENELNYEWSKLQPWEKPFHDSKFEVNWLFGCTYCCWNFPSILLLSDFQSLWIQLASLPDSFASNYKKTVDHHMTAGDNWDFNYLRVRSHFGPISNGVLFLKHLTTPFLYHNPQSAKTHYYPSTTPRTRVLLLWFVSFFLVATRCPHDSSTSAPNEKTIHNKKWNWTNDFSCAPKGERVFATTGNRSLYRNNLRRVEQQLAAPQPTMLAREREQTSLSDRRYAFKNTFCHVSYLV